MSTLQGFLDSYRQAAISEREKGTYFEELIRACLRNKKTFREFYTAAYIYVCWGFYRRIDTRNTGIDNVASTQDNLGAK